MTKQFTSIALAACVAALISSIAMSTAQAKQCSAAMPSHPHGYWSWRLIDGRKCWYEGKAMISKSLLEWSAQAAERPASNKNLTSALPEKPVTEKHAIEKPALEKPGNPLDSQARLPADAVTFEALWRARVEQH